MNKTFYSLALFLLFSSITVLSQTQNNEELQKLFDNDQQDRMVANIDWTLVSKRDSIREARVFELIQQQKMITGLDYYNSAMVLQHGNGTRASSMAVKQMKKALELDTTINRWLLAAAIDRDLMYRNEPQIYGTQFTKMGENGKWERYKIDTTQVTDKDRRYYHVETLAEQRIKERNMNLLSISSYSSPISSIHNTIEFIKSEKSKGNQSGYNVSEEAINNYGYELMNANKNNEAQEIFKLNTDLYPDSYNAFDSYGECLLKLDKKKEGIEAYKKSLALNPKNTNAIIVLDKVNSRK